MRLDLCTKCGMAAEFTRPAPAGPRMLNLVERTSYLMIGLRGLGRYCRGTTYDLGEDTPAEQEFQDQSV